MIPRAHKKPIPVTYRGWLKEIMGLHHMKKAIIVEEPDQGSKWARGMLSYADERLAYLKANKPRKPKMR